LAYRILAIDGEASGVLAGHADGVWIVEPVKGLTCLVQERSPLRPARSSR
jgi:hypothetical protein